MAKVKLDDEYSTPFVKEKEYLSSKGIRFTFLKYIDGVTVFKYKRTRELFLALAEYYK